MAKNKHVRKNKPFRFITGLMIGWLAGTTVMLLFAPQAGEKTRALIEAKSIELREQTDANIKKAFAQVRSGAKRFSDRVQGKADEMKQIGQDKLIDQMDRVSAALDAGKKAVKAA